MKFGNNSKQVLAVVTFSFLVMTGTYNAIVINSESSISSADMRFAKRLDEVYGTMDSKREVAAAMNWKKLSVQQVVEVKKQYPDIAPQDQASKELTPVEVASQAAVKEELNLNLTSVINPKKWQQGLNNTQFNGSLATNDGVIESLNVSLPNGEGVSVSFSELTGNVFEYDFEGQLYSGILYQEGQNTYAVNLTNGPLEGTRLTFTAEPTLEQQQQLEQTQRELAESSEAAAGDAGEVVAEAPVPQPEMQAEIAEQDQALQQQQPSQEYSGEQNAYMQNQDNVGQPQQFPEQANYNLEQQPTAM